MDAEGRIDKLVERIGRSWRPVVVEAAAGSRKHELCVAAARSFGARIVSLEEVTASAAHSVKPSDKTDKTLDLASQDESFVVMERTMRATDPAIDQQLADDLEFRVSDQPCVVSARRFGPRVRELVAQNRVERISAQELWFDIEELTALSIERGGNERTAQLVYEVSDGWPRLIWDVQQSNLDWGETNTLELSNSLRLALDRQMSASVEVLSRKCVDVLQLLAVLDVFNDETVERLEVAGALDAIADAGVPILDGGSGWNQLPGVVRKWLQEMVAVAPTDGETGAPKIPQTVLEQLCGQGHEMAAIEAALHCAQRAEAAELVAGLSLDRGMTIAPGRIINVIDQLSNELRRHPRALLIRGRLASWQEGDLEDSMESFRHGIAVIDAEIADRPELAALREKMTAELALALYFFGDLDAASDLLPTPPAVFDDLAARGRQFDIQAGIHALSMTQEGLERAQDIYRQAEETWLAVGQLEEAASTRTRVAVEVVHQLGHLNAAAALLDRNGPAVRASPMRGSVDLLFRARMFALLGRREEALNAIADARPVIMSWEISWLHAYELNARLILASEQGRLNEVAGLEKAIRKATFGTMKSATGALLLADWVDAYIRCGSATETRRCFGELENHPNAEQPDVSTSRALVACHFGDAVEGLGLVDEYLRTGLAVPRGQWRLDLARATAFRRLGQPDRALASLADARVCADSLGTPDVLDRAEAAVVSIIKGETAAGGSERTDAPVTRCQIRLFDRFEVTVDGAEMPLHNGRPQTLLKSMVLEGGYISVDQASDLLWPDADPATGRRRLRNTLNRLRSSLGPVIDRDGELLRLNPDEISSDYERWFAEAAALMGGESDAAGLTAAINAAPAELLPADRYEEWVQAHRRNYEITLMRLIDRRIEIATAAQDHRTTVQLVHRVLDIDPYATHRLDAAIELANANGMSRAAELLEMRREG